MYDRLPGTILADLPCIRMVDHPAVAIHQVGTAALPDAQLDDIPVKGADGRCAHAKHAGDSSKKLALLTGDRHGDDDHLRATWPVSNDV